jgi:hypothetical protein
MGIDPYLQKTTVHRTTENRYFTGRRSKTLVGGGDHHDRGDAVGYLRQGKCRFVNGDDSLYQLRRKHRSGDERAIK